MAGLGQNSYTRDFSKPTSEETDTCYPRFFSDAEQTMIDGVPGWREVEMVEIIMPGNNQTTKPVQYVNDIHKARWPKAYAAFKANEELALVGTPLEQWPILKRAQVLQLKSMEFRTVEDISAMGENAIQKIGMGARELKKMAEVYVDGSKKDAVANKAIQDAAKFEARCAEQDTQIRGLNEQLQILGDQVRQYMTNQQHAQQNIASTPAAIPAASSGALMGGAAAGAGLSPFAKFATLAPIQDRVEERRAELGEFNTALMGVQAMELAPAGTVDLQIPARRGRKSNAQKAAEAAAGA